MKNIVVLVAAAAATMLGSPAWADPSGTPDQLSFPCNALCRQWMGWVAPAKPSAAPAPAAALELHVGLPDAADDLGHRAEAEPVPAVASPADPTPAVRPTPVHRPVAIVTVLPPPRPRHLAEARDTPSSRRAAGRPMAPEPALPAATGSATTTAPSRAAAALTTAVAASALARPQPDAPVASTTIAQDAALSNNTSNAATPPASAAAADPAAVAAPPASSVLGTSTLLTMQIQPDGPAEEQQGSVAVSRDPPAADVSAGPGPAPISAAALAAEPLPAVTPVPSITGAPAEPVPAPVPAGAPVAEPVTAVTPVPSAAAVPAEPAPAPAPQVIPVAEPLPAVAPVAVQPAIRAAKTMPPSFDVIATLLLQGVAAQTASAQ